MIEETLLEPVDTSPETYITSPLCPMPILDRGRIIMGHGSGGKLMQDLIAGAFLPPFDNPILRAGDDAGVVTIAPGARLVVSTDSHVVRPLFFPGGDIGRLAVCGTVNDVAMMGARPLYLTAGFILEEGLEIGVLEKVVESMQRAAAEAGVQIIAGDTKVVERGKADGLYINTAGIGLLAPGLQISGGNARPGDAIILSGTMGDHGIAVLAARGDLGLEADLQSDVAPLNALVGAIVEAAGAYIHVLRDPTRGGVAAALNEIARSSHVAVHLKEEALPIRPTVAAACELLGFDPLHIANEGKLLAFVAPEVVERVLSAMRRSPYGADAVQIGHVEEQPAGRVLMRTGLGTRRVITMPSGEILPRIC